MKLIATNHSFSSNLSRLIKTYPQVSFAVAWASSNTEIFSQILAHTAKVQRAVIGTHFYQTHPDVLDAFVDSAAVRFILQPRGVFHPKIYLFWNTQSWEALIGSANLTNGALTANSEAMLLVSDSDEGAPALIEELKRLLENYWSQAKTVSRDSAASYRILWQHHQPALRRLSGQFGNRIATKSPEESPVRSMSWNQFLAAVKADREHGFEDRCGLLERIRAGFNAHRTFASMDLGLRQTVAGVTTQFDNRWAWFGSMNGAGYFRQAVNSNNPHISAALDDIPLQGLVSRSEYERYLDELKKAFPNGGMGIAVASRLLAMKRPDQFVCVDSRNQEELYRDIGITGMGMDYDRYWEEIIELIMDSPWWNSIAPIDPVERSAWNGRAAMLDAIFYRP